jgi:glucokinase
MILAGDIGGTKCTLGLFSESDGELTTVFERTYPSAEFKSLEAVAKRFFKEPDVSSLLPDIRGVCFGIAGPVVRGHVQTPNLPWSATDKELERELDLKVMLINDLVALGYGVTTLRSRQTLTLNEGRGVEDGHMALIAAGTGLGEAVLVRQESGVLPISSEGGHADFAPRDQLEIELLQYLMRRWHHVSYERVLSGPGLLNIYEFLRDSRYGTETSSLRARIEEAPDPSPLISQAAMNNECEICVKALDIFVSLYGAEAGNLALSVKATGGVFVGGGIAPKILAKLRDGRFMEAFYRKGRMESLLRSIPVQVILEPKTAFHGAARYGNQLFG